MYTLSIALTLLVVLVVVWYLHTRRTVQKSAATRESAPEPVLDPANIKVGDTVTVPDTELTFIRRSYTAIETGENERAYFEEKPPRYVTRQEFFPVKILKGETGQVTVQQIQGRILFFYDVGPVLDTVEIDVLQKAMMAAATAFRARRDAISEPANVPTFLYDGQEYLPIGDGYFQYHHKDGQSAFMPAKPGINGFRFLLAQRKSDDAIILFEQWFDMTAKYAVPLNQLRTGIDITGGNWLM